MKVIFVNEFAYDCGDWGVVTKSMQDHTGTASSADPNVQYAYEDGASGADLEANYVRPTSVTYPGPSTRRAVWYNYASTGVGAPMARLDNIADDDDSPTDTWKYGTGGRAGGYIGVSFRGRPRARNALAAGPGRVGSVAAEAVLEITGNLDRKAMT